MNLTESECNSVSAMAQCMSSHGLAVLIALTIISGGSISSQAAVLGFVETFSGSGEFDSSGGVFSGLDNPGR